VPPESFADVGSAAYVVPRWIGVASKDVDESSANALHVDRSGMFWASEDYWEF